MPADPARGLLVIGIGSELHGDDAAGRVVAARIDDLQLEGVRVRSLVQLLPELVEDFAICAQVVFVDADPGCAATTVRDVQAAAVGAAVTHHLTPARLLRLAATAGVTAPRAVLVGVPARSLDLGSGLSPQTRAGVEAAVAAIRRLASELHDHPVARSGRGEGRARAGTEGPDETKGWQSRAVQRWNSLDEVPAGYGPSVVTIGNFDGVHRGHAAVLTSLVADARGEGAQAVAITFDPHPIAVLHPDRAPAQLTGLADKLELLATTGLDAVLVMRFTRELASWEPERFVREVLVDALGACVLVVGRDTRFGRGNSGDVDTLRDLGKELGFRVEVIDDLGGADETHPSGRRWSSTWARELISEGDVITGAEVLGRLHRVIGIVVHGDHRGRELGYPTANLSPDASGLVPADGVYAGRLVRLDLPEGDPEHRLPAAVSVGTNPTFDGAFRRVEAYVLDRSDLDLYGRPVAIEFVKLLRPTLRFDEVQALVTQMALDVAQCRAVLRGGADSVGDLRRW